MASPAVESKVHGIERGEQDVGPPSLLSVYPFSQLRAIPLPNRPESRLSERFRTPRIDRWIKDHQGYSDAVANALGVIETWIEDIVKETDCQSDAATYKPIDAQWIESYYSIQDRSEFAADRSHLLQNHSPRNAILMAIDLQAAFGAPPGSAKARKVLIERSFGAANLREAAEFIGWNIKNQGPWTVFTTMQHGGNTTMDRWHQQEELGLVGSDRNFLLCSEGSSDVMLHPMIFEYLGYSKSFWGEYEYRLLEHALTSSVEEILKITNSIYSSFSVIVKPERTFGAKNIQQILSVRPTDFFLLGADIHVCLAEIAEQLKTGVGFQPNIWMIYDLSTTRPSDFEEAKRVIDDLAHLNHYIYLIDTTQAKLLMARNKITLRDRNIPSDLHPSLESVIRTLAVNYARYRHYYPSGT